MALPLGVNANHTEACSESNAVNRHRWASKVPTLAPTGVRGTTEAQSLDICTSSADDDRASTVWIAVDDNGGHPYDLIQAGRITCESSSAVCDQAQRKFWAWGRHSSQPGCQGFSNRAPVPQNIGGWVAGSDDFIVARDGTSWEVFVDGVLEQSVSQASICWTKKRALWAGETWDIGDAMGGPAGNKYALTNALYQTSVGGGWLNPGFAVNGSCENNPDIEPPFYCVTSASSSLSIWTEH